MSFQYVADDIPGARADDVPSAYEALGYLHGRHRPLQARILHTAGRGMLSAKLLALAPLQGLDSLVHRLDIPRHASRAAERVDAESRAWIERYCRGFTDGLKVASRFERSASATLVMPTLESMIGGLLVSSYLGLAQGQERMERALIEAIAQGANAALLQAMHAPYLEGWAPDAWPTLPRQSSPGHVSSHLLWAGGSNAWALAGDVTASKRAMLCNDPHLQLNQLPSLFFETRLRVGDDYWLGASIPGLAALALGRTKHLAWGGTFSVADNVDWFIEDTQKTSVTTRRATIGRRGRGALELEFRETANGVIEGDVGSTALSVAWAGPEAPEATLAAYLRLPLAKNASDAVGLMDDAMTLSLHFVLADSSGDVWYRQVGRIPRREPITLAPRASHERWQRTYRGDELPRWQVKSGFVATANEHRLAPDGSTLNTLFQPEYRLRRIEQWLGARRDHDVASMQRLQLDVQSLQAERLAPLFVRALGEHSLAALVGAWDRAYSLASFGAVAFERLYVAARDALADELGGEWMRWMLRESELPVWWCNAFDRVLLNDDTWQGARGERLTQALRAVRDDARPLLGDVQRYTMNHMLLGGAPGASRSDLALPGSRATVRQGTIMRVDGAPVVVGPAYRFVTDFAEDCAWTALPGGVDGSPFARSYMQSLDEWQRGDYHRLSPP